MIRLTAVAYKYCRLFNWNVGRIVADEQSSKKRRIVKNPETFRERAVKASEQTDQPSRKRQVASAPFRGVRAVFRSIGRGFRRLGRIGPFKIIARALHYLGLILVPRYFRNSWKELKLVTWPTLRESRRLTGAVLIFAFIFGVIIAVVDYGLDKLFKEVLLK